MPSSGIHLLFPTIYTHLEGHLAGGLLGEGVGPVVPGEDSGRPGPGGAAQEAHGRALLHGRLGTGDLDREWTDWMGEGENYCPVNGGEIKLGKGSSYTFSFAKSACTRAYVRGIYF